MIKALILEATKAYIFVNFVIYDADYKYYSF